MAANASNSPRRYYTIEEYFALEHAGEARYEYWDGDIVCMSGGTLNHSTIGGNIFHVLRSRLGGNPCRPFNGDLAVKTPSLPPYRYPDVSVVCGEPKVEDIQGVDALLNPVIIIEVLSPSTESRDRGSKFAAYQQIPTFREYVLVAQDAAIVTHYLRQPDGTWVDKDVTGFQAIIRLESAQCELSLAEIYEGVTFSSN